MFFTQFVWLIAELLAYYSPSLYPGSGQGKSALVAELLDKVHRIYFGRPFVEYKVSIFVLTIIFMFVSFAINLT